ncbi:hypothetical protein [Geodermatophilus sp. URMC 65]
MSASDETMAEIVAAVEVGRGGARAEARRRLTDLWERVGPAGDPLHRVTLAHFLADLQDDVRAELRWDEPALMPSGDLTDERAQQYDAALRCAASCRRCTSTSPTASAGSAMGPARGSTWQRRRRRSTSSRTTTTGA